MHTPGIYALDTSYGRIEIVCGKYHIAECGESVRESEAEALDNARRIVKCVNAHDDLVAALQGLLIASAGIDQSATHDGLHNAQAIADARAALAKAKGK